MTTQAKRERVLDMYRRRFTLTEISRQLNLPSDEVRAIIRNGTYHKPKPTPKPSDKYKPEFIEPPLFE